MREVQTERNLKIEKERLKNYTINYREIQRERVIQRKKRNTERGENREI